MNVNSVLFQDSKALKRGNLTTTGRGLSTDVVMQCCAFCFTHNGHFNVPRPTVTSKQLLDWVEWVLLYVHRNRWFIRDGSPGRPPGLSHSSWALLNCSFCSPFMHLIDPPFCLNWDWREWACVNFHSPKVYLREPRLYITVVWHVDKFLRRRPMTTWFVCLFCLFSGAKVGANAHRTGWSLRHDTPYT